MSNNLFLIGMPGGTEWILILAAFAILGLGILWILAIVEIATSTFKDSSNKLVWLLIVILLGFIGAIIYAVVGRQQRVVTSRV